MPHSFLDSVRNNTSVVISGGVEKVRWVNVVLYHFRIELNTVLQDLLRDN